MNNNTYLVVDISEVNNVDYSQVLQTSAETVRKSIDNSRFILKYDGDKPQTVTNLESAGKLFSYSGNAFLSYPQILEIVATPEWTGTYSPFDPPSGQI